MRISTIIDKFEEYAIIFFLSAMTLLTFSQVIARYVFNSGVVWALELTTYFFAWLVLIGASYLIKHGLHITVSALVERFEKSTQKILTLIAIISCMIFVVIIFIGSWQYIDLLHTLEIEMQDLPILEWHGKIVLPLGFLLMFYRLVELFIKVYTDKLITMHFSHTNVE